MQFQVTKSPAKLDSFTPRAELHGEEKVPACSIGLTIGLHSSALDQFDPSYRPFLFREETGADEGQGNLTLVAGDKLTALAKPKLKALKLAEEFPGYTLRIHAGLDSGADLVLSDAKLSGFEFKAISGGSVEIGFSVAAKPDEAQAGRLYGLVQQRWTSRSSRRRPSSSASRTLRHEGSAPAHRAQVARRPRDVLVTRSAPGNGAGHLPPVPSGCDRGVAHARAGLSARRAARADRSRTPAAQAPTARPRRRARPRAHGGIRVIYVSTKPNLLRDGYESVAEKISERCRTGRGLRYCVFVDWEGKVTIRPRYDQKSKPLPDGDLVGTYDRHGRIETIEGDLIERMRELSKKRRAA